MRYIVLMPSNRFGLNYSDGRGCFTANRDGAFVFDEDSEDAKLYGRLSVSEGRGVASALVWAERHAKAWARIKKKKIIVVPFYEW